MSDPHSVSGVFHLTFLFPFQDGYWICVGASFHFYMKEMKYMLLTTGGSVNAHSGFSSFLLDGKFIEAGTNWVVLMPFRAFLHFYKNE